MLNIFYNLCFLLLILRSVYNMPTYMSCNASPIIYTKDIAENLILFNTIMNLILLKYIITHKHEICPVVKSICHR